MHYIIERLRETSTKMGAAQVTSLCALLVGPTWAAPLAAAISLSLAVYDILRKEQPQAR